MTSIDVTALMADTDIPPTTSRPSGQLRRTNSSATTGTTKSSGCCFAGLRQRLLRNSQSEGGDVCIQSCPGTPTTSQHCSLPSHSSSTIFASSFRPGQALLPLARPAPQIMLPTDIRMSTATEQAVHRYTSILYLTCMLTSAGCAFLAPAHEHLLLDLPMLRVGWFDLYYGLAAFWFSWLVLHLRRYVAFPTSVNVAKRVSLVVTLAVIGTSWTGAYSRTESPALGFMLATVPAALFVFHIFSVLQRTYAAERVAMEQLTVKEVQAVACQGEQLLADAEERRAFSVRLITKEIRDASRIGKATIMHLAPATVLAGGPREHLAACSVPVPTASVAAVDATLRHIEHLGRHLERLTNCESDDPHKRGTLDFDTSLEASRDAHPMFDVGELVQRVGDMIAGSATCAEVEVVIYHAEARLCHQTVYGDEMQYQHLLLNLLKMVIQSASAGAWIELGLTVATADVPVYTAPPMGAHDPDARIIHCTFRITHSPSANDVSFVPQIPNANESLSMVAMLGGQLVVQETDDGLQVLDIVLPLASLSRSEPATSVPRPLADWVRPDNLPPTTRTTAQAEATASEPSLDELHRFIGSLGNLAVSLHAPNRSILAKHVTSWLTLWGTDISHISIDGNDASADSLPKTAQPTKTQDDSSAHQSLDKQDSASASQPPTFIIIDDDVATLKRQLRQMCTAPLAMSRAQRSTPARDTRSRVRSIHTPSNNEENNLGDPLKSASSTHLPGKLPTTAGALASPSSRESTTTCASQRNSPVAMVHPTPTAMQRNNRSVIHFTSIGRYQAVKQAVSEVLGALPPFPLISPPQVLVIPKPIGPRRFLTALHTAITRPHMDTSFYIPIATSPATPGLWTLFNGEIDQNPMERAMVPRTGSASSSGSHDLRHTIGHSAQTPLTFTATGVPNRMPTRHRMSSGGISAAVASASVVTVVSTISGSVTTSSGSGQTPLSADSSSHGSPTQKHLHSASSAGGLSSSQPSNSTSSTASGGLRVSPSSSILPASPRPRPVSPMANSGVVVAKPASSKLPDNAASRSSGPGAGGASDGGGDAVDSATNTPATDVAKPTKTRMTSIRKKAGRSKLAGKQSSTPTPASTKSHFITPPIKVLIVEDNPINQTILSTFLRKRKIEYGVASDGLQAVEMWKQGGFHLVLMDIQLPVLDGIDATKEIRRLEKERKAAMLAPPESPGELSLERRRLAAQLHSPVIIVALTASALQADRNAALAAGCNDFLTKPVSLQWLEKKITEWGCMQALINFDDWRRWKRRDEDKANIGEASSTAMSSPAISAYRTALTPATPMKRSGSGRS